MKLADELLAKTKVVSEAADDKKADMDKKDQELIEKLMKESYGDSNDDQKKMVKMMEALADSESDASNKFMKHMDESASMYGDSGSNLKKKELEDKKDK